MNPRFLDDHDLSGANQDLSWQNETKIKYIYILNDSLNGKTC